MNRLALLVPLLALTLLSPAARGDDDDHDDHDRSERRASSRAPAGVAPVTDATWTAECSSCHMAYPPGLLPARSWSLILGDLAHHYGDDATVSDAQRAELLAYATSNAADVSGYRLSQGLARATRGTTPTRISTIPGLAEEHREHLSASFVKGNPEIRSLANCAACHTHAKAGSFRESEINVPGRGWWDD